MSNSALVSSGRSRSIDRTDGNMLKTLEFALSEFGSILSDDERKQLHQIKNVPDASAALVFTARLDASNSSRRGKSIGARAYSMLRSVQQFATICDTFISARPEIAALVWGSIKLTVLIATNITSYFESLADLFMGLNKYLPRLEDYQLLFPSSQRLQESICTFHAAIVQLCKQAILLTRQPWIKKVSMDLRGKLSPQLENIQNCAKNVKNDIALAKATYDRREQEHQEQERKFAANHRHQLSIFARRSQKEMDDAREWQMQRDQKLLREKQMNLLDTLSTYSYQVNFHQNRKKRHVDTATWLLTTPEFIKWKDCDKSSVFILTGKLGSGKTVLTQVFRLSFTSVTDNGSRSSVIDGLHRQRERKDESITFVFPRFDESISLKATTVLRSIIRQCLEPVDMTGDVETQVSKFGSTSDNIETVVTLLQHCVGKSSLLYIIIDALDEFEKEERDILLRTLASVMTLSDSKLKLFLVGRSSAAMEIKRRFPAALQKSANGPEVQADITTYIEATIAAKQEEQFSSDDQLILEDPALAEVIIQALIHGANGMFLWVNYQIIELCECTCDLEIRDVLRSLPKDLGETFDRALKRIAKRGSAKTASDIFKWVAAAKRPLTLEELREALSYEPGIPYSIAGRKLNGLERVATWCGNLVQVDQELQTVQFAHQSVLQHLLENPSEASLKSFHTTMDEADHLLGEICVTYLNSNDFKTDLIRKPVTVPTQLPDHIIERTLKGMGLTSRVVGAAQKLGRQGQHNSTSSPESRPIVFQNILQDSTDTLHQGHPFLQYALQHWLLHTRSFEEGRSKTWSLWKQMIHGSDGLVKTPWSSSEFLDRAPSVFEWLDKYHHPAVLSQILSSAKLKIIDRTNLIDRYLRFHQLDYADIVINSVNSTEDRSNILRHYDSEGKTEIVRKLLNFNINVDDAFIREDHDLTVLQAAAGRGHLKFVQTLLNANADVNAPASKYGVTALQIAAERGHLAIVQTLLSAGANVNIPVTRRVGRTALQAAAERGHLEVVQTLLNADADVNAPPDDHGGRTALQAAAEGGHLEVVQTVLNANAYLNAPPSNYRGQTALQAAARNGHLAVVQTLLDAGVDVNASPATPYRLRTALQAADEGRHYRISTLLRSHGARE